MCRMVTLFRNTTPRSNNILRISACSILKAPLHFVRMFSLTSAFDPSRNKGHTGSHASLFLSPHQRPDTLLSQRSGEHTLGVSAPHTSAKSTASGLTMQRYGIFLGVRIHDFVKPVLYPVSAGFIRMFPADTTDIVRDIGHIISTQQC